MFGVCDADEDGRRDQAEEKEFGDGGRGEAGGDHVCWIRRGGGIVRDGDSKVCCLGFWAEGQLSIPTSKCN